MRRSTKCTDDGKSFAVILMDLDRFKEVNDTLGHDYGDVLLKTLGPRLAEIVGPGGLVARLGGDEFAIFPGLYTDDVERARGIRLRPPRLRPAADHGGRAVPGARREALGSPASRDDGKDAHTLLRRADLAMYAAKEAQTGWRSTTLSSTRTQRNGYRF